MTVQERLAASDEIDAARPELVEVVDDLRELLERHDARAGETEAVLRVIVLALVGRMIPAEHALVVTGIVDPDLSLQRPGGGAVAGEAEPPRRHHGVLLDVDQHLAHRMCHG